MIPVAFLNNSYWSTYFVSGIVLAATWPRETRNTGHGRSLSSGACPLWFRYRKKKAMRATGQVWTHLPSWHHRGEPKARHCHHCLPQKATVNPKPWGKWYSSPGVFRHKCLTINSLAGRSSICSVCQFPWYNYPHFKLPTFARLLTKALFNNWPLESWQELAPTHQFFYL